jgi:hypothetical protein
VSCEPADASLQILVEEMSERIFSDQQIPGLGPHHTHNVTGSILACVIQRVLLLISLRQASFSHKIVRKWLPQQAFGLLRFYRALAPCIV